MDKNKEYPIKDKTKGKLITVKCWNCGKRYKIFNGANIKSLPCDDCRGKLGRFGWSYVGGASILRAKDSL